jgi:serine protease SohB
MFFNFGFKDKKSIEVTNLNKVYARNFKAIAEAINTAGNTAGMTGPFHKNLFVLDFRGDIMATQAKGLAEEITSILTSAVPEHAEVLVIVNSGGGAAHAYGYAASQLERIKEAGIKLTVAVDHIAASGGYMMAAVADEIIAAPWSIIGSVGVVAEFPNFFDFLENLGINYKQYTAGKFKRTVGPFGRVTEEGEKKLEEDIGDLFELFKAHVGKYRTDANMDEIATGEHWQAARAKELGLVDKIQTSEDYILESLASFNVLKVKYIGNRKTLSEKLSDSVSKAFENVIIKVMTNLFGSSRMFV